jgi:hypothetical protein
MGHEGNGCESCSKKGVHDNAYPFMTFAEQNNELDE